MYDVLMIGAGIIGTMLARELSFYDLKTVVCDMHSDVADGTTMANSAIVHTGYDPEDGTMKAKMNVLGARMYPELLEKLHCRYKVPGAFIAACGEEEEEHLEILRRRADQRGIHYRILSGEEARKEEPHLSDGVTKVIDFDTTRIIYPWEVALRCMENAMANGTELYLDNEVRQIIRHDGYFTVITSKNSFDTRMVISCAGTASDRIYDMVCDDRDFTIIPRKGEYYVLDHDVHPVNHIVFPVPGPAGKGVLAVPTVYGNTLIGPNALETEFDDVSTEAQGLASVKKQISKTLRDIPMSANIHTFAGVRATCSKHDFLIEEAKQAPGFVYAAGIESPGLASAPAIAAYIRDTFVLPKLNPKKKENITDTVEAPVVMNELSLEERNAMIEKNPLYGKMVCRCEQISEQEIIDCIHRMPGATTITGVKKRVRPGMGKCQGGFCQPQVLAILARETGRKETEIRLGDEGSEILVKENR